MLTSIKYNCRQSDELLVRVTRDNSSIVYHPILKTKALFAIGACGAGKSTYALYGLLQHIAGNVLVVQPSSAAASFSKLNFKNRAGSKNWHFWPAMRALEQYETFINRIRTASLVVVDEVHTELAEVAYTVECVRQKAKKYILITATPSDGSSSAQGVVVNTPIISSTAGYGALVSYGSLRNTVWDPNLWPYKSNTKMMTYPVSDKAKRVLTRYYTSMNKKVVVIDKDNYKGQGDVYLIMPGVGDGLTIDANYLIDTGCDHVSVSRQGVLFNMFCRLTFAGREQRWSRVGRIKRGVVVAPDMVVTEHAISRVMLMTALIACVAAGLNVKTAMLRMGVTIQVSTDAARYAVKQPSIMAAYYGRIGNKVDDVYMTLFVGEGYSVPAVVLDTINDVDYRELMNNMGTSNMSLTKAVTVYNSDPIKYRPALIQLAFGRKGTYSKTTLAKEQCFSETEKMGLGLNEYDWGFLNHNTRYRKGKNGHWYSSYCSHDTGPIDLCDEHDYATGEPQARFAQCVGWLQKLKVVHVPSTLPIANKYLFSLINRQLLVKEGVEPKPGPRTLMSRLSTWNSGNNYTIALSSAAEYEPDYMLESWQDVNEAYQHLSQDKYFGSRVLIAYYDISESSNDVFEIDEYLSRFKVVGFQICDFGSIRPTRVRTAKMYHMDVTITGTVRTVVHITQSVPPASYLGGPISNTYDDSAYTIYKLNSWKERNKRAIVFAEGDDGDLDSLEDATTALSVNRDPTPGVLFSKVLLIYVEEGTRSDFDIRINNVKYKITSYHLSKLHQVGIFRYVRVKGKSNAYHTFSAWMV